MNRQSSPLLNIACFKKVGLIVTTIPCLVLGCLSFLLLGCLTEVAFPYWSAKNTGRSFASTLVQGNGSYIALSFSESNHPTSAVSTSPCSRCIRAVHCHRRRTSSSRDGRGSQAAHLSPQHGRGPNSPSVCATPTHRRLGRPSLAPHSATFAGDEHHQVCLPLGLPFLLCEAVRPNLNVIHRDAISLVLPSCCAKPSAAPKP